MRAHISWAVGERTFDCWSHKTVSRCSLEHFSFLEINTEHRQFSVLRAGGKGRDVAVCFSVLIPVRFVEHVCWATRFHTHSLCHFTRSHMRAAKRNEAARWSRAQCSRLMLCTEWRKRVLFSLISLVILILSDCGYFGFGRRDAGGEREQRGGPPGQAEEEVPQPVHPQDQQHRAGPLRPAERPAGGTGDHSLNCTRRRGVNRPRVSSCSSGNCTALLSVSISLLLSCCFCEHP